jgi:cystathionine beta-lyase/cystathionine gamma-synthase
MTSTQRTHLETLLPHAGQGTADGEPLVTPITQSTTFCRDGLTSEAQHCYSRQSNPTVAALETTLGQLENAPPAVCYSTGLAAESALFLSLLSAGDHIVCSRALYGGTTRILQQVFPNFGVETSFVDTTSPAAVERALRLNTKLVFLETPSNPTLALTDLAAVAEIAHRGGALVAVDNTFLTPLLQQPLDHGADFSIYSTTKFIEGHSVALGGSTVTRSEEHLERLRFVRTCTGGIQTPFNAWLTLQGLKTLGVRLDRQCSSALKLAQWLSAHPAVGRVHYPKFASSEQREIAERQHLGADGAVVSFELKSGSEGAKELLRRTELCRLVEHVGGVETLITHSASMTHGGVPKAERELVGVTEGLVRISVGLEPVSAIIDDLQNVIGSTNTKPAQEVTPCPSAL